MALISIADTIMVGVVGPHAIAAVGLVTQPRFIVLTLIMALNMAVTCITARRRGENDQEGAVRCLKQSLILSLGLSVVLSVVAYLARRPLLYFAGAQDDTIALSLEYFEFVLIGTPICALLMTISAAQRGIGQTKISMVINMVANAVCLVANYLLIGGRMGFPALGVRGAGVALLIGWSCGLVIAVLSLIDRRGFLCIFTKGVSWKFDRETLSAMYKVSSGSFVEQICLRIGFLSYAKIVAGLGTMMFATHQILMNILSLSFSVGDGLGIAASALVGISLGERRPDLSIMYGKVCQRMSFVTCSVLFLLFTFQGRNMIHAFTTEPEIITTGAMIMPMLGIILFGQASQMILMGSLRGAGDTKYTAIVSLICVMILRPGLSYILIHPVGWGLIGAWIGLFVDQYLRLVLTARRFSSGKWMNISL